MIKKYCWMILLIFVIVAEVKADDATAPSTISNLTFISSTNESLLWAWINPADADFNYTLIFIDGVNIANLSSEFNSLNVTGFVANTSHTIDIWTADNNSNVNNTDVNDTESTLPNPDLVPPGTIIGLINVSATNQSIYWNWTNPADSDFSSNIVFIDGINLVNTSDNFFNASGFTDNTSHMITIWTMDNSGNVNDTNVSNTAWTLANPDLTPPGFIGISILSVTNQSAIIAWNTTEDSNATLKYGVNLSLLNMMQNLSYLMQRIFNITGLVNSTLYYYNVSSCDSSGNCNSSGIFNFTTLKNNDTTPPGTVSNLKNISATNVSIYWNWSNPPDPDFNATIIFVDGVNVVNTSSGYYNATVLNPNSSYTITVWTKDDSGNVNDSNVSDTASTLMNPDTIQPVVDINYNPSSPNSTQNITFFANASDASGIANISLIINNSLAKTCYASSCNYTSGFFSNGTNITFYAIAYDNSSNHNLNQSDAISFIVVDPLDLTPPSITAVSVGKITNQSAVITWDTDENSNSTVNYGLNLSLSLIVKNSSFVISHNLTISGLMNFTEYYFDVSSCDSNHNCNSSGIFNFTTLQNNDTTPPGMISNLTNESETLTSIYWTWINPSDIDFSQNIIFLDGVNLQNTTNQYFNATNLTSDSSHTITVWTVDTTGNINDTNSSNTALTLAVDIVPPVILNMSPSGNVASTTSVTLTAYTDENATCRYNSTDVLYDNMTGNFNDNGTLHTADVNVSPGQAYVFYMRCRDYFNNTDNASSLFNFTVQTSGGGNGGNGGSGGGGGGGGGFMLPLTTENTTNNTPITSAHDYEISLYNITEVNINISTLPILWIYFDGLSSDNATIIIDRLYSVDVPLNATIYQYMNISLTSNVSDAKIISRVSRLWMSQNNITNNSIYMYRFHGSWEKLNTTLINWTDDDFYYESLTPGFSYFAIAGIPSPVVETVPVAIKPAVKQNQNPVNTENADNVGSIIVYSILVITLIFILESFITYEHFKRYKELSKIASHHANVINVYLDSGYYPKLLKAIYRVDEYIEKALKKGHTKAQIKQLLVEHKWNPDLVDKIIMRKK